MTKEVDSDKLELREASPAQHHQTHLNSFSAWGTGLTLNQYIAREQFLMQYPYAKLRLHVWVLVPKSDPMTLDILAACETYSRPCVVVDNNQIILNQTSHTVATVFTPVSKRNRGYASIMMEKLFHLLGSKEEVIATTLYSDIGPKYYCKLGWDLYSSESAVFKVKKDDVVNSSLPMITGHINLKPLTVSDLKRVSERDIQNLISSIRNENQIKSNYNNGMVMSPYGTPTVFAVLPTADCQEWLHGRAIFYSKELLKRNPPQFVGCEYINNDMNKNSSSWGFITWYHDFTEKKLMILRLFNNENNKIVTDTLIRAAIMEARAWELEHVELWDPAKLDLSGLDYTLFNRKESLSCMKLFLVNNNNDHSNNNIRWILNEKFAWS